MRIVVAAALVWATILSYLAIARHDAFDSNAFDLGYVTQTLWNTAHGRPFVFTTVDGLPFSPEGTLDVNHLRNPHSLLAFHVEPLVLLIAPLFLLWPDPRLLLVLQSTCLAAGAIAIAALARRRTGSDAGAIVFGTVYLLSPSIVAAALSDFHVVTAAAALIPAALYLGDAGRPRLAFVTAMLAAFAREDAAILVAALGGYLWLRGHLAARGQGLPGNWLLVGAGGWAAISLGIVIPFFNGTISALIHHQPSLGSVFWHRYEWLGATPLEAVRNVVERPMLLTGWFGRGEIQAYLLTLAMSGGLIALLAPDVLAIAAPIVLLNALSSFDWMRSGGAHYSVILVPVVLLAGIESYRRLSRWIGTLAKTTLPAGRVIGVSSTPILLSITLIAAVANQLWLGASPVVPGLAWPRPGQRQAIVESVLATIPADASVAATSAVYPHIATRERAYWFPATNGADYVAIDAASNTNPMSPRETNDRVATLLAEGYYQLTVAAPGFLLLQKSAQSTTPADFELPDRFYDFARDRSGVPTAAHRLGVEFGESLHLDAFDVEQRSSQTIFGPSAIVTTYWHVDAPIRDHLSFVFFLTRRTDGAMIGELPDAAAEPIWYPPYIWRPGETVHVRLDVPRVDDLQAIGVAVLGDTGERLPIQAPPSSALWENGTIVRIARLDER
jgi:uncharacterized membrane protein